MPQAHLIHETDGAQVGLEGSRTIAAVHSSGTRVTNRLRAYRKRVRSSWPLALLTGPSFSHPSRCNNVKATTLRFAAVTSTIKVLATSRQALCRSIRALEMAAFKGKPFRE